MLRLVADGWPNQGIAQALHVAEVTVEFHVRHVREKLGARSRAHVALRAVEQGIGLVEPQGGGSGSGAQAESPAPGSGRGSRTRAA